MKKRSESGKIHKHPRALTTMLKYHPLLLLIYYGLYWSYSQGIAACLSIIKMLRFLIGMSSLMLFMCGPQQAGEMLDWLICKRKPFKSGRVLLFSLLYSLLVFLITLPAEIELMKDSENSILVIPFSTFTLSIVFYPVLHNFLDHLHFQEGDKRVPVLAVLFEVMILLAISKIAIEYKIRFPVMVGETCIIPTCFLEFMYHWIFQTEDQEI